MQLPTADLVEEEGYYHLFRSNPNANAMDTILDFTYGLLWLFGF